MLIENMDSMSSLVSIRRHYKKDSQYLNNLYTLTYDTSMYSTNELFSSLHNTIHNTDIEEQNVSFPTSILWSIMCIREDEKWGQKSTLLIFTTQRLQHQLQSAKWKNFFAFLCSLKITRVVHLILWKIVLSTPKRRETNRGWLRLDECQIRNVKKLVESRSVFCIKQLEAY